MPGTSTVRAAQRGVQSYRDLERRIARGDLDALHARWDWGRQAIEDGRTTRELAAATGVSQTEAANRIALARQYVRSALSNAQLRHGSWHGIVAHGLGTRRAPASQPEPRPEVEAPTSSPVESAHVARTDARHILERWKALKEMAEDVVLDTRTHMGALSPEARRFVAHNSLQPVVEALQAINEELRS